MEIGEANAGLVRTALSPVTEVAVNGLRACGRKFQPVSAAVHWWATRDISLSESREQGVIRSEALSATS